MGSGFFYFRGEIMQMRNDTNASIMSKAFHKKHGEIKITGDFDRPSNYFAQYKLNDTFYYITNVMPFTVQDYGTTHEEINFILPKDLVDKWEKAPLNYRCIVIDWGKVYDFSMEYVYRHLHTSFPSFYKKNICYRTDTINPTFFNESNEIIYKGTKEDLWLTNFLQTFQPKPCSYSKHREYSNVTILNQEFKSLAQFCELYGINPNCMDIRRLKIKKPDYSTWTFEEVLDIACPIK